MCAFRFDLYFAQFWHNSSGSRNINKSLPAPDKLYVTTFTRQSFPFCPLCIPCRVGVCGYTTPLSFGIEVGRRSYIGFLDLGTHVAQVHELWLRLNYVEPRLARQPWCRHSKCQKVWEILGRRLDGFDGVDGTWLGHYIDSDMVIRFIKKFPCASCWCFMQVMNIAERSKFPSSAAVLIRAQNQRRNFDALLMKQLFDERLYHPAVNASPPL